MKMKDLHNGIPGLKRQQQKPQTATCNIPILVAAHSPTSGELIQFFHGLHLSSTRDVNPTAAFWVVILYICKLIPTQTFFFDALVLFSDLTAFLSCFFEQQTGPAVDAS